MYFIDPNSPVLLPRGALDRWRATADELTAVGLSAALRRLKAKPTVRNLTIALAAADTLVAVASEQARVRVARLAIEIDDALATVDRQDELAAALGA